MSASGEDRLRVRAVARDPHAMTTLVRRMWAAGADTDAIARAMGTHRAAVAEQLQRLEDSELLEGLRAHLDALVIARAAGKPGRREKAGEER